MFFRMASGGKSEIGVLETRVHFQARLLPSRNPAGIDPVTQAASERLAVEAIHHGFHRFGLVALDFESEFHS